MLMSCRNNFVLTLCVEIISSTHEVHFEAYGENRFDYCIIVYFKGFGPSEPLLGKTLNIINSSQTHVRSALHSDLPELVM